MVDRANAGIRPDPARRIRESSYKITTFTDKACNDDRLVDRDRIALDQDNEPAVEGHIDAAAHFVEVLMHVVVEIVPRA